MFWLFFLCPIPKNQLICLAWNHVSVYTSPPAACGLIIHQALGLSIPLRTAVLALDLQTGDLGRLRNKRIRLEIKTTSINVASLASREDKSRPN